MISHNFLCLQSILQPEISVHFLSIIKTLQHSCKVNLTPFRRQKIWDMDRKKAKILKGSYVKIFPLFSLEKKLFVCMFKSSQT